MNIHTALQKLGVVAALALFPLSARAAAAAPEARPNILWITSEDNSARFIRHFDPSGAPMPNLERLAREGLTFDRAFSNAPVCSPARSAIISGSYGPRVGAQWHRHAVPAPMPEGLRMFPWYLRQAGYYTTNNVKTDYNLVDTETWDESSNKASWRGRRPGQPFFHVQNHTTTHESGLHLSAEELAAVELETDPATVRMFPFHPDTPEFRRTYALYHDRHRQLDRQIGELLERLREDGLEDDTIVFYYGDNGGAVPGTKGYARDVSLHVPLVVWFPPKWRHLAPATPGSRIQGFVSFVDLAPTVLNLAGLSVPDAMDGRAFLGQGVSLAEVESRDEAFGYADRFDERYDLVRTLRKGRFLYKRNFLPYIPESLQNNYRYKMPAFRQWRELHRAGKLTPAQRAFFEPRAPEGLYDVEADPFELNNLAADPAHAPVLADMRQRLRARMLELPDLGLLPESIFVRDASGDPVAYGRAHVADLGRALDAVDLSLRPFEAVEHALRTALTSDSALERFWALAACSALGDRAAPLLDLVRTLQSDDPDRLVRVRAAEFAMLVAGDDPSPTLVTALQSATDPVEAAIILNTVAWLKERDPSRTVDIDATWFPMAWRRHAVLAPRLEYLDALKVRPANPGATPAVVDVLTKLRGLGWDAGVLAGQRVGNGDDAVARYAEHVEALERQTGAAPAFVEVGYAVATTGDIRWEENNRVLLRHWRRGGLVGVHIPLANPITGGDRRDKSIRPDLVALTRPGGDGHQRFMRDLDAIADGLTELRDAGVVVLFRPFHEANGGWFWWGRRDPEQFRELWRFVFRHFTETRKLDNLVWVYAPSTVAGAMSLYPGDAWVDVLGYSIYRDRFERVDLSDLDAMLATGKPVGATEIGMKSREDETVGAGYNRAMIEDLRRAFPEAAFFLRWQAGFAIGNLPEPETVMRHRDVRTLEWLRRRADWRQESP